MTSYAYISSTDGKRAWPYYDPITKTLKKQTWAGAGGWSTAIGGSFFNDLLMIQSAYLAAIWAHTFAYPLTLGETNAVFPGGETHDFADPAIELFLDIVSVPEGFATQGANPGTGKYGYVAFAYAGPSPGQHYFGDLHFVNFKRTRLRSPDRESFTSAYIFLHKGVVANYTIGKMDCGPLTGFTSAATLQDVNPLSGPFPVSFS